MRTTKTEIILPFIKIKTLCQYKNQQTARQRHPEQPL